MKIWKCSNKAYKKNRIKILPYMQFFFRGNILFAVFATIFNSPKNKTRRKYVRYSIGIIFSCIFLHRKKQLPHNKKCTSLPFFTEFATREKKTRIYGNFIFRIYSTEPDIECLKIDYECEWPTVHMFSE
jgi:hypothetical protein